MSIAEGTMTEGAEYADFEIQEIATLAEVTPNNDTNPNLRTLTEFEPLEDRGGLDANEVAELVYLEVTAHLEIEDEEADQNVATTGEVRGYVGANSGGTDESTNSVPAVGNTIIQRNDGDNDTDVVGTSITDQGRFQIYQLERGLPFDDQTNGPGGNSSGDTFHAEKNMRELFGRGPVLDVTDSIDIFQAVNVSDTVVPVQAGTRAYCVWDTATVDEAGREFSVPK
jgi:hypothetical protein